MVLIDARSQDYKTLNQRILAVKGDVTLTGCMGQRFIATGASEFSVTVKDGIPGNALGAYLNGATVTVMGNAQDAVGDTMNHGRIVIHGNVGDAVGYAMRGGEIYVKGDAGYRAGIHMKEYNEKRPVLVIGGKCGSFLGEYQAGGIIIVLGLEEDGRRIVNNFPCTGMHGGKVFLRTAEPGINLSPGVTASPATEEDLEDIRPYVEAFCAYFGYDPAFVLGHPFTKIVPDSHNPYKQMYVAN
ncbi:MAG: glutamate synthase [Eubacteriales bacterium]|nr:glutamate synthase [Eubacteriales bacterium]